MSSNGLRWDGVYSEDGRYMIQTARIRHAGTEYRVHYSPDGGPPYDHGLGIYNTLREAKAVASEHAQQGAE